MNRGSMNPNLSDPSNTHEENQYSQQKTAAA